MATKRWRPAAAAKAQVTAYVFGGTWEATDVINLTVGGKVLSVVAGSTTITTIIDSIVTAWNALDSSLYPEFAEITASRSSSSLVLTADTEGVPFACTVATTETGGGAADAQTIDGAASSTGTDSTACQGPNFWNVAANWSDNAVPANGDTVWVQDSDVSILYGLAQSGVTLAALHVTAGFTGSIGLPDVSRGDAGDYIEYRARYLAIGATLLNVGAGEGQGSNRILIDAGSVATTVTVLGTGSGEDGLPALLWKGTDSGNVMNVNAGSVGVAWYGGETATVATLRVGFRDSQDGDSRVVLGGGVTITTLNQSGGEVELNGNITTVSKTGGTLTVWAGTVTTLTDQDGTTRLRGTGTVTTLTVGTAAVADFSGDMRAITVTNCTLAAGASLLDPFGRVTFTNPFRLSNCAWGEVTVDVGVNRTIQVGT